MDAIDPKAFKVRDLPPIWGIEAAQEWLIEGMIPTNTVTMLTGESGSGKSSVTLALADAVSKGELFLGRHTVQKPVLIVDRENGVTVYHERIQRFGIEANPNLLVWGLWTGLEPGGPNSRAILEFAKEESPLIIFDSFIAFHPGSEQDAAETRKYMEWFRKLTGCGATVLIIHHTGKGEFTKEYRGSSDIKASIDVGLVLIAKSPLLKLLSLRPWKSREGVVEPLQISLEGQQFVVVDKEFVKPEDPAWAAVKDCIHANPGLNQSQISKLVPEIAPFKVRKILIAGELNGLFHIQKGLKNASFYFLGAPQNAQKQF